DPARMEDGWPSISLNSWPGTTALWTRRTTRIQHHKESSQLTGVTFVRDMRDIRAKSPRTGT
ncbi:Hypothetical predicted protein, partial [Pelobates cultripes]